MIEIHGVIGWSAEERPTYEELATREIHIATRDMRRALGFYERVFGFRAIGGDDSGPVIVPATARTDLVIHDLRGSRFPHEAFARAFGFVVTNLDLARERAWELGVEVARDSGMPDQIYRWSNGRSLYLQAPDGNEIELVEMWNGALRHYRMGLAEVRPMKRISMPGYLHARHAAN